MPDLQTAKTQHLLRMETCRQCHGVLFAYNQVCPHCGRRVDRSSAPAKRQTPRRTAQQNAAPIHVIVPEAESDESIESFARPSKIASIVKNPVVYWSLFGIACLIGFYFLYLMIRSII